jgi:fatty acid desaturase
VGKGTGRARRRLRLTALLAVAAFIFFLGCVTFQDKVAPCFAVVLWWLTFLWHFGRLSMGALSSWPAPSLREWEFAGRDLRTRQQLGALKSGK